MMNKTVTKLKIYLMEREFTQKELAQRTCLSTNTINKLVNKGKATPSVLKLVSYELNISLNELKEMLQ